MAGIEKVTDEKQEDDISSSSEHSEHDKISDANDEERNNDSKDENISSTYQVVRKKKAFMNLTNYKKNYEVIEASTNREHGAKNDKITSKTSKDKNDTTEHSEVTDPKIIKKNENNETYTSVNGNVVTNNSEDNVDKELTDLSPEEAYIRHMERVIAANVLPREDMEILKDLYARHISGKNRESILDEIRTETGIDSTKHGESTAMHDEVKPILDTSFKDRIRVIRSSVQDIRKDSVPIESSSSVVNDDKTDSFEKPDFLENNDQILTSTPKSAHRMRRVSSELENTDDIECDVTNLTIESPFSDFSLQKVKLRTGLDRNYVVGKQDNEAGTSNIEKKENIIEGSAVVEIEGIKEDSPVKKQEIKEDGLVKKQRIKDDNSGAKYQETKGGEYIVKKQEIKEDSTFKEQKIKEYNNAIIEQEIKEDVTTVKKQEIKDDDKAAKYSETKGDEYIVKKPEIKYKSNEVKKQGTKKDNSIIKEQKIEESVMNKQKLKDDNKVVKHIEIKGDEHIDKKLEVKEDSSTTYQETKGIVKNDDIKNTTSIVQKQKTEKDIFKEENIKDSLIKKQQEEEVILTDTDQSQFSNNLPTDSQTPNTSLGTSPNIQLSSHHENTSISNSHKQLVEDLFTCECPQTETNTEFVRNSDVTSIINRIRRYFLSLSTEYLVFRQAPSNRSKVSQYF